MLITSDVIQTILSRASCRAYSDRQPGEGQLRALLAAGHSAPYAGPRHFCVIQNKAALERVNALAKQSALRMEIEHLRMLGADPDFHCIYHAPVLVIVSCPNEAIAPKEDASAAAQNMLIAAQSLGLSGCWLFFPLLAFMSPEGPALLKEFGIPEGYAPAVSAAFGYAAEGLPPAPDRGEPQATFVR